MLHQSVHMRDQIPNRVKILNTSPKLYASKNKELLIMVLMLITFMLGLNFQ